MFMVNLDPIKTLMAFYSNVRAGRKVVLGKAEVIRLFTRDTNLIGDSETLFFYGMSKMTVVNEKADFMRYNFIVLVEFCEMIARVAAHKFVD